MAESRDRLLDLLATFSFERNDDHPFQLSSGRFSPVYINCKATTMRSDARTGLGELVSLLPADVEAVGGLTMGADPIAYALAFYSFERLGRAMEVFVIRKEPKKHGLQRWVEGSVRRGSKVAVVDDVVTTGGSTVKAIQRCREEGLSVVCVLVLVDRGKEDGDGMEIIRREAGPTVPVMAVFTRSEVEDRWRHLRRDDSHTARLNSAALVA